ncbi:MAG: hypothetical protein GX308_03325 [Epulopiscium sp.]|nr:hypothetical protein [Candidatus Epulonipiscium sp.]
MSSTKIIVLRLKEVIYTSLFAIVGLILLLILIFKFIPQKRQSSALYEAGIYTVPIELEYANFDISVTIEKDKITSVELINFDEDMAMMYPLMEPTMAYLNKEITKKQMLDVGSPKESPETAKFLLEGIKEALNKPN